MQTIYVSMHYRDRGRFRI